jgi:hypothetical protein
MAPPTSRKPASLVGKSVPTSQARANFAEALSAAHDENTVIGFNRYGRLIAALVSIDAVRMLAGRGDLVEAGVREKIERMARIFLGAAARGEPASSPAPSARGVREQRAAFKAKPARGEKPRKRGKDKKKKKARAKAARAKRSPRLTRKI